MKKRQATAPPMWREITRSVPLSCLFFHLFLVTSAQPSLLDSTVRYDYLSGDTVATRKEIYRFDPLAREIERIVQTRRLNEDQWQNDGRTTTSYALDFADTITQWEYIGQSFQPIERVVLTKSENRSVSINQTWISGTWINETKQVQVRIEGQLKHQTSCQWSADQWQLVDSLTVLSNSQNQITSDTQYVYLPLFRVYLPRAYSSRYYNDRGDLIEHQRFEYDADSLTFLPRSRDTFGYDQDGFQLFSQFDLWLTSERIWDASLKIIRSKNEHGLLDSSKILFQDFVSGELRPTSRLEYQYFAGSSEGGLDTILRSVKNIIYQGPFEVPDWKRWYFYGSTITAVQDRKHYFQFYPNPAKSVVYLRDPKGLIKWYRLLSLEGKIIQEGAVDQHRISLPQDIFSTHYVLLQLFDKFKQPYTSKLILLQP